MSFHFIVFSGGESDEEKKSSILTKNQEQMELAFLSLKKNSKKDQEKMFKLLTFLISQAYLEAESDGKNQSCKKEQDTDTFK